MFLKCLVAAKYWIIASHKESKRGNKILKPKFDMEVIYSAITSKHQVQVSPPPTHMKREKHTHSCWPWASPFCSCRSNTILLGDYSTGRSTLAWVHKGMERQITSNMEGCGLLLASCPNRQFCLCAGKKPCSCGFSCILHMDNILVLHASLWSRNASNFPTDYGSVKWGTFYWRKFGIWQRRINQRYVIAA